MDFTIDGTLFLVEDTHVPLLTVSTWNGSEVVLPLSQVLAFLKHLEAEAPHLLVDASSADALQ